MSWFSFVCGLFLILFGVSIIFKEIFGISLPLVRLAFAVMLIYMGLLLIRNMRNDHSAYNRSSYHTVFNENVIDLTDLVYTKYPMVLDVSTTLGSSTIYIDKTVPTKIIAYTSFAEVKFPDNTSSAFGTTTYNSHYTKPDLVLRVNTSFGKTVIKEK